MAMECTVREACPGDYSAIYRLNKQGLGYDFDINSTKDRLEYILDTKKDKIFVAEAEDGVIGYIHAADYECTYSEPLKNILALVVDESKRGLGMGRRLLEHVEAWAKDEGAAGVRLVSSFNRQEAHSFYLACGYAHRKDQKNFVKIF